MLKLLMAQFGVHVDQTTVDDMIKNVTACIDDVKAMRASQERTEAMVLVLYKAGQRLGGYYSTENPGPFGPDIQSNKAAVANGE